MQKEIELDSFLIDEESVDLDSLGLDDWFSNDSMEVTLAGLEDFEIQMNDSFSNPVQFDNSLTLLYQQATEYESTMLDLSDFANQMALYGCMYHNHGMSNSFGLDSFNFAEMGFSTGFSGMGGHEGHDHCEMKSCGGHYDQFGRCEKCGTFKLRG